MSCAFFIFEVTVLIYIQIAYFESQLCIGDTPLMYFWLMSQILLFYIVLVVVVCYFFRKFCQDPKLEAEELQREKAKKKSKKNKKETTTDGKESD